MNIQGNDDGVKQDYLLKKNDIIKLGRVKLKIKDVYLRDKVKQREKRQKRR